MAGTTKIIAVASRNATDWLRSNTIRPTPYVRPPAKPYNKSYDRPGSPIQDAKSDPNAGHKGKRINGSVEEKATKSANADNQQKNSEHCRELPTVARELNSQRIGLVKPENS